MGLEQILWYIAGLKDPGPRGQSIESHLAVRAYWLSAEWLFQKQACLVDVAWDTTGGSILGSFIKEMRNSYP